MKFQIKHRFTAAVIFECELTAELAKQRYRFQLGFAVKKALEEDANLREADLRGADLRGADLREADLREADLGEADLGGADLGGADLRGADLGGADLRGADLREADLGGADLRGADLRGADLREADLGGADLRGADLGGADLREADLGGADLRGADLGGADLRGADLGGADLRGADLREADLGEAKMFNEEFIYLQPIHISGFAPYFITIAGTYMHIGCELHKIEDWEKFKKIRIEKMDNNAWEWWQEYKPLIMPIAQAHMEQHLIEAEKHKEKEVVSNE